LEYKIALIRDLPRGTMRKVTHQGKSILLANIDGKYYAIGNNCTHLGCFLSAGILEGEKIQCPCKGSIFNIKTGEVVQGPAEKPEPTYQLKVENSQIFLIL
jgi:nitrite reductase/ring-hydroxylating ferredoxin subunit